MKGPLQIPLVDNLHAYRHTVRVPRSRRPERPTYRRSNLGRLLRHQRGERRAVDVAAALGAGWSDSRISRIESGESGVTVPDVRVLLNHYGTPDPDRTQIIELAKLARQVGWWDDYKRDLPPGFGVFAELEEDAEQVFAIDENLVSGVLQTADYALEVMQAGRLQDSEAEIERRVAARMARRDILDRENPPKMTFVISETALQLPVGGPVVMRGQLQQLLDDADRPNVSIHLVPTSAGPHAATNSPFTLFDLPRGVLSVVYSELFLGSRYEEDAEIVAKYRLAFNAARAVALSTADSAARMAELKDQL